MKQILGKIWMYLPIGTFEKTQEAKQKFADNHDHNILKLFDNLQIIFFHHKWNEAGWLVINSVYTSCFTRCLSV